MILGLAVIVSPTPVLEAVAGEAWEIELLRYGGALAVGAALLWPWARRHASVAVHAAMVLVWLLLAAYLVSATQLALVVAFSLLAGVAVNVAVGRGYAAGDELRRRLTRDEA